LVAPRPEAKADRCGIFRRNDFQKMPLLRSFSQLGKFSTKISPLAELERAEFTAETRREIKVKEVLRLIQKKNQ
jgi:hypothetical protein